MSMLRVQIKKAVFEAVKAACPEVDVKLEDIALEHPAVEEHGDYSTNIAMVLAKHVSQNPRELAGNIVAEIKERLPKEISKIEVAGPGFINFYLSPEF